MRLNAASRAVFDLHDRGIIELPDDVVEARRHCEVALSLNMPTFAPPKNYLGTWVGEQLVAAIKAGKTLNLDAAASEAARQLSAANIARQAIGEAQRILGERVDTTVATAGDDIIVESLRPVHDQFVAELKDGATPEREAELVALYGEIDRAAAALRRLGRSPKHDVDGQHARIYNAEDNELFPMRLIYGGTYGRDIPAGIVEKIRAGAEMWLPTVAEQDKRHLEANPKAAALKSQREFDRAVRGADVAGSRERPEVGIDMEPRTYGMGW